MENNKLFGNNFKMVARPWRPQDLLDDLQLIIAEESNSYLNTRRTTLEMALAYLKEHFAEPKWIPVTEQMPQEYVSVLICVPTDAPLPQVKEAYFAKGCWWSRMWIYKGKDVTHWMPMPEPPKEESQ